MKDKEGGMGGREGLCIGTLPPFGCQAKQQSDLANEVSLHFERMGSTFTHSWGNGKRGGERGREGGGRGDMIV